MVPSFNFVLPSICEGGIVRLFMTTFGLHKPCQFLMSATLQIHLCLLQNLCKNSNMYPWIKYIPSVGAYVPWIEFILSMGHIATHAPADKIE